MRYVELPKANSRRLKDMKIVGHTIFVQPLNLVFYISAIEPTATRVVLLIPFGLAKQ